MNFCFSQKMTQSLSVLKMGSPMFLSAHIVVASLAVPFMALIAVVLWPRIMTEPSVYDGNTVKVKFIISQLSDQICKLNAAKFIFVNFLIKFAN